jgi:hypothetical protein
MLRAGLMQPKNSEQEREELLKQVEELRHRCAQLQLRVGSELRAHDETEIADAHSMGAEDGGESRRMLQAVLDAIPVRVFWKDTGLNYLGCNRSFAIDAGLRSPEQVVGKSDFDLG